MTLSLNSRPSFPAQIYTVARTRDLDKIDAPAADREYLKRVFSHIKDWKEKGSLTINPPTDPQRTIILVYHDKHRFRKTVAVLKSEKITAASLFTDDLKFAAQELLMAEYVFDKYKSAKKDRLSQIEIVSRGPKKQLEEGLVIGQAVNFARDLANTPGGEMTPEKLAKIAAETLTYCEVTIYNQKDPVDFRTRPRV
jgi:leucyl aminopeptidase